MTMGSPGDHPVSDLLVHGLHPFPQETEALILKLHAVNPGRLREVSSGPGDPPFIDTDALLNILEQEGVDLEPFLKFHR